MKTSHPQKIRSENRSVRGGFTLFELIMVISIIGILTALTVPSVGRLLGGPRLSQGAQMLIDWLNLARQSAISLNRAVEIRFYQFGDPSIPGETAANPNLGKYRAMQMFEILESGSATALGKMQRLPPSVIIDAGAPLSSIINSAQTSPAVPTLTTGGALNYPIPTAGTRYNAICFCFLPDGSARLSPSTNKWYLTLHSLQAGDALKSPPPNYFTIQINAINGHIQSFRP